MNGATYGPSFPDFAALQAAYPGYTCYMKLATAYMKDGRIFLHASCKTTAGVWILCRPVLVWDRSDSGSLGEMIFDVLDGSQENVPHPKQWKGGFDPVMQLAGVKSWSSFARSAKCVGIEFATNRVSFVPTKNLGARDGFEPIEAKRRTSSPVKDDVGAALLRAFDESE